MFVSLKDFIFWDKRYIYQIPVREFGYARGEATILKQRLPFIKIRS